MLFLRIKKKEIKDANARRGKQKQTDAQQNGRLTQMFVDLFSKGIGGEETGPDFE